METARQLAAAKKERLELERTLSRERGESKGIDKELQEHKQQANEKVKSLEEALAKAKKREEEPPPLVRSHPARREAAGRKF